MDTYIYAMSNYYSFKKKSQRWYESPKKNKKQKEGGQKKDMEKTNMCIFFFFFSSFLFLPRGIKNKRCEVVVIQDQVSTKTGR